MVDKASANLESAASPRSLDMGDAAPPARAAAPAPGPRPPTGFRLLPGRFSPEDQDALVARQVLAAIEARRSTSRDARRPPHECVDDQPRPPRLDDRRQGLPLSGPSIRSRASPGRRSRRLFSTFGARSLRMRRRPTPAWSTCTARARGWASTRIATKSISARPWSRCRSATPPSSAWAASRGRDPSRTVRLASGDVCVLSGEARLALSWRRSGPRGLLQPHPRGGRLNLTLRRAR